MAPPLTQDLTVAPALWLLSDLHLCRPFCLLRVTGIAVQHHHIVMLTLPQHWGAGTQLSCPRLATQAWWPGLWGVSSVVTPASSTLPPAGVGILGELCPSQLSHRGSRTGDWAFSCSFSTITLL